MKTVVSHKSALEYWRSIASDAGAARQACRAGGLPAKAPSASEVRAVQRACCRAMSAPLHVLSHDGRRGRSDNLVVHQLSEIPGGSLRRVDAPGLEGGVFVTSPELTFIQVSGMLDFPHAVHLGFELCGTYAPDESQPFGVRGRQPLTTPEKLAAFRAKAAHVRGSAQARSALPYVLANSASPRESTLAMLATLPYARGGSMLAQPVMNSAVAPGKRHQGITGKSHFRCDLLWPEQNVVVEYDSTLCHTGAERIARDASRRNALEAMGLTVVTATWRQVANYQEYNRFVKILAGHLRTRIRPGCSNYAQRQFALRRALLS